MERNFPRIRKQKFEAFTNFNYYMIVILYCILLRKMFYYADKTSLFIFQDNRTYLFNLLKYEYYHFIEIV